MTDISNKMLDKKLEEKDKDVVKGTETHFLKSYVHPYDTKNCFIRWFYILSHFWQLQLLRHGIKRPLEPEDIWDVPMEDSLEKVVHEFDEIIKTREKQGLPFSISKIIYTRDRSFILAAIFNQGVGNAWSLVVPYMIKYLTAFLSDKSEPLYIGIIWTIGLFLASIFRSIHISQAFTVMSREGVRVRNCLMHLVYRKSIRMSLYSRNQSSTGQTVNLMSQDAEKISNTFAFLPLMFMNVLVIFVCIGLLYYEASWASLIGLAFLLLTTPIQGFIGKKIGVAKRKMLKATDERVKFINETLQGIKIAKLYAWELPLMDKIQSIRQEELKRAVLRVKNYATISAINYLVPQFIMLITLGVWVLVGNTLTISKTFTVMSLINAMRVSIAMLPMVSLMIAEGKVSLKRMSDYFCLPELVVNDEDLKNNIKKQGKINEEVIKNNTDFCIILENSTFSWLPLTKSSTNFQQNLAANDSKALPVKSVSDDQKDVGDFGDPETINGNPNDLELEIKDPLINGDNNSKKPTLFNISLKIKKNTLTAIIGMVGSGKSSLINAILGEMDCTNGYCYSNGSIGYTSQTPFIINASLRNNILFGLPYDRDKYKKVLKAAALLHDIDILPDKDFTEIGERGINLSGGQKARVSYARALYRYDSSDIFIFDDPLSAVDMEVGNTMFHDGILNVLNNKTRVIVMNSHLHLLSKFDQIVILSKGEIVAIGRFDELINNSLYNKMLSSAIQESKIESEKHIDTIKEKDNQDSILSAQRKISFSAIENKYNEDKNHKDHKLITKEDREIGSVSWKIYSIYFSNAIGNFNYRDADGINTIEANCLGKTLLVIIVVLLILSQLFNTAASIWLALFSEQNNPDLFFWLGIWTIFVILLGVFTWFSVYLVGRFGAIASQNIHMKVLYHVFRAPMSYFDKTPVGRIINRFGKDTEQLDDGFPTNFSTFAVNFLILLGAIAVIIYSVPYMLILLVPLMYIFYYIQQFFRQSSRELKRIESVSRSPIFAEFSETLNGLDTIRAYNMANFFLNKNKTLVTINSKLYLQFNLSQRWLGLNLDILSAVLMLGVALFGVFLRNDFNSALVALAITYSSALTGLLQWTVRTSVELENSATSVERLVNLQGVEQEARAVILDNRPNPTWPEHGQIKFDSLVMRYRQDLKPVLNGIDALIKPGEKVGICGRTGAGKSSLLVALFRLVEPESKRSIIIDKVDIQSIGLRDLRSKLSIIPQDPVLFSGTIRFNLDPFNEHTDDILWTVLKKVHLFELINNSDEKLNYNITESGTNLSQGQKQLICIGRALLRNSRVMLLDEATASVDSETDSLIQSTIRENFKDHTVLTIAHRLDTILDSDRIMVLSDGQIIEFDTPNHLLAIKNGVFANMVQSSKNNNEN